MNRNQILWLEACIGLGGGLFWIAPPALPYARTALLVSLLWAVAGLSAIWLKPLETLAHRFSSFFGFLFFTVEGVLGLLPGTPRPWMLGMALLHGAAFVLSAFGRYRQRVRRRPRRELDEVARQVMEQTLADQSEAGA